MPLARPWLTARAILILLPGPPPGSGFIRGLLLKTPSLLSHPAQSRRRQYDARNKCWLLLKMGCEMIRKPLTTVRSIIIIGCAL